MVVVVVLEVVVMVLLLYCCWSMVFRGVMLVWFVVGVGKGVSVVGKYGVVVMMDVRGS